MAKKRGSKNEWKRYEKFEQENEKLRKEVSKLRKYAQTGLINKMEQRAHVEEKPMLPTCENCGNESIHLIPIERKDGHFEIRICELCKHRTELKKTKNI